MGRAGPDFFEYRDRSKRRTALLVFLFALAVTAVMLAVYLVVHLFFISPGIIHMGRARSSAFTGFSWYWFSRIAAVTGALMVGGTVYKMAQLMSGGGAAIARMLNATPVDSWTKDPLERRFLNVIEEMSIASGVPVPSAYVLKGQLGINAFAAGLGFDDAVVAVTEGAMKALKRDELQGVVAHEFSHILNADMKLNMHLVGWLHGIMMIAAVGRILVSSTGRHSHGRGKNQAGAGIFLGLLLLVIGYIGYFFARLIQVAVSRQREVLADSSAVQFTRNPLGLAGALKKIGGYGEGAAVHSDYADEVAHMFFGEAISSSFLRLFSTHPPLEERIKFLDPSWNGRFPATALNETPRGEEAEKLFREESVRSAISSFSVVKARPVSPEMAIRSVGAPTPEQVDFAAAILEKADDRLLEAARDPAEVTALISSLLLGGDEMLKEKQYAILEKYGGTALREKTAALKALLDAGDVRTRLPLADISAPAVKKLGNGELTGLLDLMEDIVKADGRLETFELAVKAIVGQRVKKLIGMRGLPKCSNPRADLSTLLSVLSREGTREEEASRKAFIHAQLELGIMGTGVTMTEGPEATPESFENAALRLSARPFTEKKLILKAMVAAASDDGVITDAEWQLVRAASELMGVPMPPLMS